MTEKTLNILVQNIDIIRFTLIFLAIIFVTLILWEFGFFSSAKKGIKAKETREELEQEAEEPKEASLVYPNHTIGEEVQPKKEEGFDPFKALMQQQTEGTEEIKIVESSVLDSINESKPLMAGKKSPEFQIEDYLSGYGAPEDAKEKAVASESISPGGLAQFEQIDKEVKEEKEEATNEDAKVETEDPWQSMISKSLEESKTTRKKPIKIDFSTPPKEGE